MHTTLTTSHTASTSTKMEQLMENGYDGGRAYFVGVDVPSIGAGFA